MDSCPSAVALWRAVQSFYIGDASVGNTSLIAGQGKRTIHSDVMTHTDITASQMRQNELHRVAIFLVLPLQIANTLAARFLGTSRSWAKRESVHRRPWKITDDARIFAWSVHTRQTGSASYFGSRRDFHFSRIRPYKALEGGHQEVVETLIEAGADVNV
jgi:hypothetical protein